MTVIDSDSVTGAKLTVRTSRRKRKTRTEEAGTTKKRRFDSKKRKEEIITKERHLTVTHEKDPTKFGQDSPDLTTKNE